MNDPWVEQLPDRSVAMVRGFAPLLNRALLVGGAPAVVVAILVTPLLADRLPSPSEPVITAAAGMLIGLVAAFLSFPIRLRRAFEAYSWLGRAEVDRFVARTGGPVPAKPADIERWLATTPSTSATRLARAEVLAFMGRHADARAELAAASRDSPEDAMELASLHQYIAWLEHGSFDTDELAAAAAALPAASEGRRMATVTIALAEARERFVRRDPAWFEPLESVRVGLGRAPSIVVFRDTWVKLAALFLIAALVAAIGVLLLR